MRPVKKLLLLVALVGCDGGSPPVDRCLTMSKCPKDPAKTTGDIKACQEASKNPPKCYLERAAFDDCFLAKAVCGSDGKTDPLSTFTACTAESDAFQKCNSG